MTYYQSNSKGSLIELLNKCESDVRELSGQKEQQQERVLKVLRKETEETLLELVQLSAHTDYNETYHYLSLLWSYRHVPEGNVISETEEAQALNTIINVSNEIADYWPSLTPKKVKRLGLLLKGAAVVAKG